MLLSFSTSYFWKLTSVSMLMASIAILIFMHCVVIDGQLHYMMSTITYFIVCLSTYALYYVCYTLLNMLYLIWNKLPNCFKVWVKRRHFISTKPNVWFSKWFQTLVVLWNIDCPQCLQFYVNKMEGGLKVEQISQCGGSHW